MEVAARVSSKGQITIPRAVREALGIEEGDEVLFRLEGQRVVMARTPNFLELAGFVDVPLEKRGTPWDEILRETRKARAAARR
ncbi:MAG: AbrB/MazE/SpoVT family DNA-binding domain-containing protein [Chloroflexi bacterium]|nr:AbrB/MazE/SpoVT family DNA-binding domain-containing protein [Chloroflexota bacterium]